MTKPIIPSRSRLVLAGWLAALLCGCAPEATSPIEPARPVKVEQLAAADAPGTESFVGTLRAHRRADLSFESAGRIAMLAVDVGDKVQRGQVLAQLDSAPAQQRLAKAEADLAAAAAAFAERDAQLQRTVQLEREQIVANAVREGVEAQRQAALSQRQATDTALALARRELALSQIKAPFDGQIVARLAQPYADVNAAQAVLQIEAPGEIEVVTALPEAVAATLSVGSPARLQLPASDGRVLPLRLDKLSARAENGALYQAIFRIDGRCAALRSGSSAHVVLTRPASQSLSLPASALLPDARAGGGQVFVLDSVRQRVTLRRVEIDTGLVREGRIPLRGGVAAGELIVVAGAPFLTDGQRATRFVAKTRLQDDAQ